MTIVFLIPNSIIRPMKFNVNPQFLQSEMAEIFFLLIFTIPRHDFLTMIPKYFIILVLFSEKSYTEICFPFYILYSHAYFPNNDSKILQRVNFPTCINFSHPRFLQQTRSSYRAHLEELSSTTVFLP